jgi:ketosteroid isomerase-like protein
VRRAAFDRASNVRETEAASDRKILESVRVRQEATSIRCVCAMMIVNLCRELTMKRSLLAVIPALAMIAAIFWSRPQFASNDRDKDDNEVSRSYQAYVQAWKNKDIAALEKIISNDYMAMNYENRLSNKEVELATAKEDLAWNSMILDEIHTRVFGNTAIASGILSAEGKRPDGTVLTAKVRFLAVLVKSNGVWQLAATQSTPIKSPLRS